MKFANRKKKLKRQGTRPTTALFYFADTVIGKKNPESRKAESGGYGLLEVVFYRF